MEIVIDTSALVAVLVGEAEREALVRRTKGQTLIGPGSIPWEIGNAFSAMFKQRRLSLKEAEKGLAIFESIPIRYVKPDFSNSLKIARDQNLYAYDAYLLDCAQKYKAPLLTLDRRLRAAAKKIGVPMVEV